MLQTKKQIVFVAIIAVGFGISFLTHTSTNGGPPVDSEPGSASASSDPKPPIVAARSTKSTRTPRPQDEHRTFIQRHSTATGSIGLLAAGCFALGIKRWWDARQATQQHEQVVSDAHKQRMLIAHQHETFMKLLHGSTDDQQKALPMHVEEQQLAQVWEILTNQGSSIGIDLSPKEMDTVGAYLTHLKKSIATLDACELALSNQLKLTTLEQRTKELNDAHKTNHTLRAALTTLRDTLITHGIYFKANEQQKELFHLEERYKSHANASKDLQPCALSAHARTSVESTTKFLLIALGTQLKGKDAHGNDTGVIPTFEAAVNAFDHTIADMQCRTATPRYSKQCTQSLHRFEAAQTFLKQLHTLHKATVESPEHTREVALHWSDQEAAKVRQDMLNLEEKKRAHERQLEREALMHQQALERTQEEARLTQARAAAALVDAQAKKEQALTAQAWAQQKKLEHEAAAALARQKAHEEEIEMHRRAAIAAEERAKAARDLARTAEQTRLDTLARHKKEDEEKQKKEDALAAQLKTKSVEMPAQTPPPAYNPQNAPRPYPEPAT